MKRKNIVWMLLLWMGWPCTWAQNVQQAKSLYDQGKYVEALPLMQKLVKQQPANANYQLWCGVCYLHTGNGQQAVKHLETAVKRRATGGQFYLTQAYNMQYRFEEAIETCETYLSELEKRKRPTEAAEALLERSKTYMRMLKGVEQVCVVDSFVVDKADFLRAYRIGPEAGKLFLYSNYFGDNGGTGGTVYESEMGNKAYYSEMQPDSTLAILSRTKLMDEWSAGSLLPATINEGVNADYPYVLSDGVTIYYAADGPQSLGGYDIFVTRYNTGSDSYLMPDNLGMPFNSPANDYLYVIDEFHNLGWFASDRCQPADKVCVYLFIPNTVKQVYNYETADRQQLIRLAKLSSISDTWQDSEALEQARQRLQSLQPSEDANRQPKAKAFEFVINDRLTYTQVEDFRTDEGRKLFRQYCQTALDLMQMEEKLEELRQQYADGTPADKQRLTPSILDLEKRIPELRQSSEESARQVRKAELQQP